jgi:hypothetical protein
VQRVEGAQCSAIIVPAAYAVQPRSTCSSTRDDVSDRRTPSTSIVIAPAAYGAHRNANQDAKTAAHTRGSRSGRQGRHGVSFMPRLAVCRARGAQARGTNGERLARTASGALSTRSR